MTRSSLPRRILTIAAVSISLFASAPAQAEDITIFAAASLKTALDDIAADWQATTGNTAVISYGGSSALAKQIQQGAPADLFISAAVNWMDTLEAEGLINVATRKNLLGNTLVLVAHGSDAPAVTIGPELDLAGLLGDGKLSMAMVDSVPAGQYGKEALMSLGLWQDVEGSVAQSENVRAALALVQTGEAPFGIVYGSDAIADSEADRKVTVVGTFPADSHAPIIYPVAQIASSTKPEATEFLDQLSSDAAKGIFEGQGFVVLP